MSTQKLNDRTRYDQYCHDNNEGRVCYLYVDHKGKHKEQPGGYEW